MFEAKLTEGLILKKIVDSIKDIVTDVNIDISPSGKLRFKAVLKRILREVFCSETNLDA
jgi:hypothetical protein